ncbi:hypothetical protein C2G38_2193870 [Gigaspora rosea]|uniref:Uncharacterized protein n=1 Tax=Gigaspora rosea TaxID=44941 RepID=A0A397V0A8_9GLOM|nr:hypothetical protein C2G38_2193870 [Gigaspora rosea]
MSCGSYNQFLKWQDKLSKQEELLPEGFLFFAFDNEQKEQKNYLNREFNIIQEVINKELHSYLAEVLQLLVKEKLLSTNPIDTLVATASTNIAKMKTCLEKVTEIANDLTIQLTNPLIFKPFKINKKQSAMSVLNQQVTDQGVNTHEIYISNLININSNLIANVEKILLHIKKISGIKNGTHK